jgi:two-component system, NtrC family, response regulator AtoC
MVKKAAGENKILIVDDDKLVSDFLERFLRQKEYSLVQSVSSGEAGLEIIKNGQVGLVFLDVMLPGMNGIEVLRKIKEINKSIGVIMITGYPDEEKAKEAIKLGAYDYIIKPFDLFYLELTLLTKLIQLGYRK